MQSEYSDGWVRLRRRAVESHSERLGGGASKRYCAQEGVELQTIDRGCQAVWQ